MNAANRDDYSTASNGGKLFGEFVTDNSGVIDQLSVWTKQTSCSNSFLEAGNSRVTMNPVSSIQRINDITRNPESIRDRAKVRSLLIAIGEVDIALSI